MASLSTFPPPAGRYTLRDGANELPGSELLVPAWRQLRASISRSLTPWGMCAGRGGGQRRLSVRLDGAELQGPPHHSPRVNHKCRGCTETLPCALAVPPFMLLHLVLQGLRPCLADVCPLSDRTFLVFRAGIW